MTIVWAVPTLYFNDAVYAFGLMDQPNITVTTNSSLRIFYVAVGALINYGLRQVLIFLLRPIRRRYSIL